MVRGTLSTFVGGELRRGYFSWCLRVVGGLVGEEEVIDRILQSCFPLSGMSSSAVLKSRSLVKV